MGKRMFAKNVNRTVFECTIKNTFGKDFEEIGKLKLKFKTWNKIWNLTEDVERDLIVKWEWRTKFQREQMRTWNEISSWTENVERNLIIKL